MAEVVCCEGVGAEEAGQLETAEPGLSGVRR
jgi:hypothetical protein